MKSLLETRLSERLAVHKLKGYVRQQKIITSPQATIVNCDNQRLINFSSNDYLGLANHPKIIRALKNAAHQYGFGAGASRLISGNSSAHHQFEEACSEFLQRDRVLLFSSGYLANIGVINALLQKNDYAYMDKYNHASLIDGGNLSVGHIKRFRHGNYAHLNQLCQQNSSAFKLIISDSVFSMSGALVDMPQLATVTHKHQGTLMIDDAHGIGVLGREGRGCIEHFGLTQQEIPILIAPLGKAFACCGAIISGSATLIEYLTQFARTYMFNTALPAALVSAAHASLQLIKQDTWRRERLGHLIQFFKRHARERGLVLLPSDTPIQAFMVGNADKATHLGQKLFDNGYFVAVIRPPSVPANTARLRISLTALHTEDQIEALLDGIRKHHET